MKKPYQENPNQRFMSLRQVSEYLGLTTRGADKLLKRENLKVYRISSRIVRYDLNEILQLLESRKTYPTKKEEDDIDE